MGLHRIVYTKIIYKLISKQRKFYKNINKNILVKLNTGKNYAQFSTKLRKSFLEKVTLTKIS